MQGISSTGLCGSVGLVPNQETEQPATTPSTLVTNEQTDIDFAANSNTAVTNGVLEFELLKLTERLLSTLTAVFEKILTSLSAALQSGEAGLGDTITPGGKEPLKPSGGFLWKPNAEKDNNLVILLPKSLGEVGGVRVLSPDGTTELAKGRFSGIANGERAHYRFSRAGAEFPDNALVEITKRDGTKLHLAIPNTAERYKY